MSEEYQDSLKDTRRTCKYGVSCYQKNPEHHKQFKHPPPSKTKTGKKDNLVTETLGEAKKLEGIAKNTLDLKDNINSEEKPKTSIERGLEESKGELTSASEKTDDSNKYLIKSDSISYHDKDADKSVIKNCFLVDMPEDFYSFYEFLSEMESIEKLLSGVNLQLIGPYELFLGKLPILEDKDLYLVHWRFFYDVPEFQAVLKKKGKSEFHIGYFRDDPKEKPVFLARNDSSVDCTITPISENIFGAVYWYLQNEKKTSPFIAVACQKLIDKLKKWAEEKKYSLDEYNIKKRMQKTVCRTFHHAGIVVPYNKKTQLGYRKLVESDNNIKKMFKSLKEAKSQEQKDKILSELQPVITFASIAMDECDFGTGLEAGVALFCSGIKELENSALRNLEVAYTLLNREEFSKIVQVHMKHRRKGPDMSILSESK
ncbi:histone PARylation factor 1 isoform X2 [Danaus plexippus]|uniref:histone PARylation factor 1 isoform X2 n=1 Tax=Danaus plexippus TaxID=13037 RepID=UPI002AB16AE0|nr:histone PARylation factor 1 isoform X2 [Danaus plexippus]